MKAMKAGDVVMRGQWSGSEFHAFEGVEIDATANGWEGMRAGGQNRNGQHKERQSERRDRWSGEEAEDFGAHYLAVAPALAASGRPIFLKTFRKNAGS